MAVLGASAAEAGEVVGKAADATGAALPAAVITLRNQATGVEQVVRADDHGEFRFATYRRAGISLPPSPPVSPAERRPSS